MTSNPPHKMTFRCPGCSKQFTALSTMAGRQVRCSGCGASLTIPQPGSAAPAAAVQPPLAVGRVDGTPSTPQLRLPPRRAPAPAPAGMATQSPRLPDPSLSRSLPATKRSILNPTLIGRLGALVLGLVVVAGIVGAFQSTAGRNTETPGRPGRPLWSSSKTKTVRLQIGTATITDDLTGTSHVRVACNNGLLIDADWKRNPYNKFGYDIYEPTVSRDYNRLAVMMTARGVIAAYLRGEYD